MAALGYEAQRSPHRSRPQASTWRALPLLRRNVLGLWRWHSPEADRVGWAETYRTRRAGDLDRVGRRISRRTGSITKADLDRIEAELYSLILKLEKPRSEISTSSRIDEFARFVGIRRPRVTAHFPSASGRHGFGCDWRRYPVRPRFEGRWTSRPPSAVVKRG